MKNGFSLPTRLLRRSHFSGRGQALLETALIAPVILLLVAGVADVGRAFYYKIAVTNAAREAAHWVTLTCDQRCPNPADQGKPPSDSDILPFIASPSQESFGIDLGLAPSCMINTPPGSQTTQQLANPLPLCGPNLSPGQSYLYIWPCQAAPSCDPSRTSLAPGMHWREVATSSQVVAGPAPSAGGLAAVLRTIGGSLYPITAVADPPGCATWTGVTVSPTNFNTSATPTFQASFTATLDGVIAANKGQTDNQANFSLIQTASVPAFQPTWTPSQVGNVQPGTSANLQMSKSTPLAPFTQPGTYTYQVQVTSSGGGGCSRASTLSNPFTITFPAAPSPSPSPSPSPTATPSPGGSPSPGPTPTGGPAPPPLGRQITCTVIYYFQPATPLIFGAGSAIYIVGTATLQATY